MKLLAPTIAVWVFLALALGMAALWVRGEYQIDQFRAWDSYDALAGRGAVRLVSLLGPPFSAREAIPPFPVIVRIPYWQPAALIGAGLALSVIWWIRSRRNVQRRGFPFD